MSEALLTLLRWCLLALVYLFFFRVLQATWSGSTTNVAVQRVSGGARRRGRGQPADPNRQPVPGPAPTPMPSQIPLAPHLMVLQPNDLAGLRIDVTGELTIGRAAGCQVLLDDGFISQRHARVAPAGEAILIEDLGSTNGTYVNQQRLTAPLVTQPGDRVQIGGVIMEFRR